jgi:hypothetical protein
MYESENGVVGDLMERTVMERLILVLIKCFANSSDETK